GDPYKVILGTSNAWQQPMVSRVAFKHTDLTPIAAMAQDEFLLWVKQDDPTRPLASTSKPRRRSRRIQDGRRAIEGYRRSSHPHDRKDCKCEIHLYSVQERRRGGRAARRRSHRFARQQSERKPWAVARWHTTPAVCLQPATTAEGPE